MQNTFDDETLMAFVDGALDEPAFSEVAAAVEADPAIAARVDALARGGDFARLAFGDPEPVPQALQAAVEARVARHETDDRKVVALLPSRRSYWVPTLAAASLAAVIAGPVGYLLHQPPASVAPLLAVGQPLPATLAGALNTTPSGDRLDVGDGVRLHPIATFETEAGTPCREFELDGTASAIAVACRSGDAWQVAIAVATPEAGGYRPASAPAAIEAWLETIGAGAPLSLEDERLRLGRP